MKRDGVLRHDPNEKIIFAFLFDRNQKAIFLFIKYPDEKALLQITTKGRHPHLGNMLHITLFIVLLYFHEPYSGFSEKIIKENL